MSVIIGALLGILTAMLVSEACYYLFVFRGGWLARRKKPIVTNSSYVQIYRTPFEV